MISDSPLMCVSLGLILFACHITIRQSSLWTGCIKLGHVFPWRVFMSQMSPHVFFFFFIIIFFINPFEIFRREVYPGTAYRWSPAEGPSLQVLNRKFAAVLVCTACATLGVSPKAWRGDFDCGDSACRWRPLAPSGRLKFCSEVPPLSSALLVRVSLSGKANNKILY